MHRRVKEGRSQETVTTAMEGMPRLLEDAMGQTREHHLTSASMQHRTIQRDTGVFLNAKRLPQGFITGKHAELKA